MPPTTKHEKMIFCATILATATLLSCDDFRMNTPVEEQSTITTQNKIARTRVVLPVKGIVEYDEMPDDKAIMLTGQVVYMFTPVSGSNGKLVDLDLLVELELKPLSGEELGWKIGGVSIDRLNIKSECTIQKTFLIDQADETRTLNLLFSVHQMQLVIKRMWILRSPSDTSTPDRS